MAKASPKASVKKVAVLPPDKVPSKPLKTQVRPAPPMPSKLDEIKSKPLIKSRIFAVAMLGVIALLAKIFLGVSPDWSSVGISPDAGIDVGELLSLFAFLVIAVLRKVTNQPIEGFITNEKG